MAVPIKKVPPNARCVPSYDFSMQKVNVQWKFTNKLLLFMVTQQFPLVSLPRETSRWGKVWQRWWGSSKGRRQTSMTRGYRSWFQYLINVWTMPASMLKN